MTSSSAPMPNNPPEFPDPVATFTHIRDRFAQMEETGEDISIAELTQHFIQLSLACQSLIIQNDRLRHALTISTALTQDLEIDLALKDIELFNFTNQSTEKDK